MAELWSSTTLLRRQPPLGTGSADIILYLFFMVNAVSFRGEDGGPEAALSGTVLC